MPAAPTKRSHLSWKYNKIVLRLPIPKPAQPILGRAMFRCVMPQTDMLAAETASLPILAEWRREIAGAKATGKDHLAAEMMGLRTQLEAINGEPFSVALGEAWEKIWRLLARLGGIAVVQQRQIRAAAQNDTASALAAFHKPVQARQTLALIDGTAQAVTPFTAHLAAWQAKTHLRGRYLHAAIASIEKFAAEVPCNLETLTGGMVQGWVEGLLKPADGSKGLLPSSVQKMLKGPRAYWTWMAANGHVDTDRKPFNEREVRDHRTARERKEAEVQSFTVPDVRRLFAQAADDRDLFAITKIGAYTGMRREEICSLTIDQVRTHDGIRYLHEVGDKSLAAIRNVPIPRTIAGLIDDLCANATPQGYLIHDGAKDKHGFRGDTVGRRFSTMKAAMGFKKRVQCFHSLRHGAIKAMKDQQIVVTPMLLSIIKNIVGHHDPDETTGRYAGISGMAEKLRVIETIRY